VRRFWIAGLALAALVALVGAVAWGLLRSRGPEVVEAGEALPFDRPVELRFPADGEAQPEAWKVAKRRTTREESLRQQELALPEPDPEGPSPEPDDSARAFDARALEAWKRDEIPQALDYFRQAVEVDPDDPLLRSHYGRLATAVLDYETARPQLERAAELDPENPQVWLDLQSYHERLLNLEQALAARERAEALAEGRPIGKNWLGFYEIEGAEQYP